jgi:hypothetical protein
MSPKLADATRACCRLLRAVLLGCLGAWAAAAPLAWILRDGLGPGMAESSGARAALKFLVLWSVPALALAAPVAGLALVERGLAGATSGRTQT